jgi:hypothetical protein
MSQTWYRDFRICVKKHFLKEYNHFLKEAVRKKSSGRFPKRKEDILRCISCYRRNGSKLCIRGISRDIRNRRGQ